MSKIATSAKRCQIQMDMETRQDAHPLLMPSMIPHAGFGMVKHASGRGFEVEDVLADVLRIRCRKCAGAVGVKS